MANLETASSIFWRNLEGGSSQPSRNSPGMVRGEPNIASETENPLDLFETDRRPRSTRGRWINQSEPARQAGKAVLSDL